MKALIWIIVIALIAWGVWWFTMRDNATAGIPATGDTSGQVEGTSDSYNGSDSSLDGSAQLDVKG